MGEVVRGKIGLEEHFAIPETLDDSRGFFPDRIWEELKTRLIDLHDRRLRLMDEHGVEMMLLSLNAPVIQAIPDPARANDMARKANDYLAHEIAKRPSSSNSLIDSRVPSRLVICKEASSSIGCTASEIMSGWIMGSSPCTITTMSYLTLSSASMISNASAQRSEARS